MPVDDLFLAGAFAALLKQLDGVFAFGFDTMPFFSTLRGQGRSPRAAGPGWRPARFQPLESVGQLSVQSLPSNQFTGHK